MGKGVLSVLKERMCHVVIATPQLVPGVARSAQGGCTAPLLPIMTPNPGDVTASSLSWYTGLDVIGS